MTSCGVEARRCRDAQVGGARAIWRGKEDTINVIDGGKEETTVQLARTQGGKGGDGGPADTKARRQKRRRRPVWQEEQG